MILRLAVFGLCLSLLGCSDGNPLPDSGLIYASAFSDLAPAVSHFTIHAEKVGVGPGHEALDMELVREYGEFKFSELGGRLTETDFPGHQITLLDDRDLAEIDTGDCETFWRNFSEKYTRSTGYFRVSEVGFNESGTEAIFYLSGHGGCLAGSGNLILMKLVNNRWIVAGQREIWVA